MQYSATDNLFISLGLKTHLQKAEFIEWGLQRVVNLFYHCQAVSNLKVDDRPRSKHRFHWEVELYSGNPPEWIEVHREALINHIHDVFGYELLKELTFK